MLGSAIYISFRGHGLSCILCQDLVPQLVELYCNYIALLFLEVSD
jgi:hypothetical protein